MHQPLILNRRSFLRRSTLGLGALALGRLLGGSASAAEMRAPGADFSPRAKRVIFLFQAGGPSQLELLDPKPGLEARFNTDLPDSVRMGQRLTGMVTGQARLPIAPSCFGFSECGRSGMKLGNLLPHTQKIADDLCLINSMHTEAINHDQDRD